MHLIFLVTISSGLHFVCRLVSARAEATLLTWAIHSYMKLTSKILRVCSIVCT